MNSNWEGIYGQEQVKNFLDRLVNSGKIPHALLFSGTNGVGKYFIALRFAQLINNSNSNIADTISRLSEPYIKFIFPIPRGKNETENSAPFEKLSSDEVQTIQGELYEKIKNPYYRLNISRANLIKISSIRDIKKFLTFNYEDLSYRVILISDAHLMNEESQNALLKNLEEPPERIIFILLTPLPMLLRETIRSRCWHINFQPLEDKDVKNILCEYFSADPETAETISHFARGSVYFALNLLDNDIENLLNRTIAVLRYSFGNKINSALAEINSILEENEPELFKLLVQLIITWLNDVLKYRNGIRDISFRKHFDTIEKFNTKFPKADIMSTANKLEYYVFLIKNNVNPNILSLNTVFSLHDLIVVKR